MPPGRWHEARQPVIVGGCPPARPAPWTTSPSVGCCASRTGWWRDTSWRRSAPRATTYAACSRAGSWSRCIGGSTSPTPAGRPAASSSGRPSSRAPPPHSTVSRRSTRTACRGTGVRRTEAADRSTSSSGASDGSGRPTEWCSSGWPTLPGGCRTTADRHEPRSTSPSSRLRPRATRRERSPCSPTRCTRASPLPTAWWRRSPHSPGSGSAPCSSRCSPTSPPGRGRSSSGATCVTWSARTDYLRDNASSASAPRRASCAATCATATSGRSWSSTAPSATATPPTAGQTSSATSTRR